MRHRDQLDLYSEFDRVQRLLAKQYEISINTMTGDSEVTEENARTLLVVCRQYAEHGKELSPELLAELERIATSDLNWSVRAEAECLIELERMA